MRLLVCGSRDWTDREFLNRHLDWVFDRTPVSVVIEGEARGADLMAADWAVSHGIPVERYPADWEHYGKAAGPVRNQLMLDVGKPEYVVAFTPDLGSSKGTADMVRRARKAGLPVLILP
jgi:hypothetical protein